MSTYSAIDFHSWFRGVGVITADFDGNFLLTPVRIRARPFYIHLRVEFFNLTMNR